MPGIQSWDSDELRAFLEHVGGSRLDAIWRLAAMTGMRRGEVLGLRWSDLDLDAARLSVRQALVAVGCDMITSTPKSHNARVIDLDAETVRKLRRHRREQNDERAEWGADYHDQDLVVAKENGEPIHPHTFSQRSSGSSSEPGSALFDYMTSAITWTAGLCGRLACFPCWACR
jgi:integrase